MKKRVLVLGCTGSIGTSTISIAREFPNLFTICGLTAHSNKEALHQLSNEFNCSSLLTGENDSLKDFIINSEADICVNGISGSAGLLPSVYCLEAGIDLALANKETIVMASRFVKNIAQENNCKIIPVDSEHSAVFSLIEKFGRNAIDKIILTASGGPFKNATFEELKAVSPEGALKHPTWNMGKKITIDSATLANKGLEVIEACRLFDIASESVQVTIHPQSLVHSFIATKDGDVYAQVSYPTMKRPILSALSYPDILENRMEKFDFTKNIEMTFSPPNNEHFPLLNLAYQAQKKGEAYTIVYNAVNEFAVDLFLNNAITFLGIAQLVSNILDLKWDQSITSIDDVFTIDKEARKRANDVFFDATFNAYRIK